jgi:hypothetical protein
MLLRRRLDLTIFYTQNILNSAPVHTEVLLVRLRYTILNFSCERPDLICTGNMISRDVDTDWSSINGTNHAPPGFPMSIGAKQNFHSVTKGLLKYGEAFRLSVIDWGIKRCPDYGSFAHHRNQMIHQSWSQTRILQLICGTTLPCTEERLKPCASKYTGTNDHDIAWL